MSTPVPTSEGYVPYYTITDGTCPSGELITDTAQCESAALSLDLRDTTVTETSYEKDRPLGCTYWPSEGILYMQTVGSTVCTSQINCICKQPCDDCELADYDNIGRGLIIFIIISSLLALVRWMVVREEKKMLEKAGS